MEKILGSEFPFSGAIKDELKLVNNRPLTIFGFSSSVIEAGANIIVSSRPQVVFKPLYLFIPKRIAKWFILNDVVFGHVSQFISANPVSCELFSEDKPIFRFNFGTINPAQDCRFLVSNKSIHVQKFEAAFLGEV